MAVAAPLTLRAGDRVRLEVLARSASARPSLTQRARIVLMSAEGLTNTEIARRTGATRPTVINWRNRYVAGGINALGDLPRSGRPAVVDELEVVATTLANGGHPPAQLGVSQWSSRLLGQHLGISFATVSRIWRKWGIQPDHVETFTFATDIQVSLGIITQQAIRRGTFASVRNLIDALSSLTDGWRDDHPESSRQDAGSVINATTTAVGDDRQSISDTPDEVQEGTSRSAENVPSWSRERPASQTREVKFVRAEFHGARGRRSRPTVRGGD